MPIIGLQNKDREIGRIRLGIKNGTGENTTVTKLDSFRLTSTNKQALETAASLYGGEVTLWKDDVWQVFTATKEIPVIVTDEPVTQWMEHWDGPVCARRCDGSNDVLNGTPCYCKSMKDAIADGGVSMADIKAFRECRPTTRFKVRLPQLEDFGVWRLESHGWNAAKELGNTVEFLQKLYTRKEIIPCILGMEQRSQVRKLKGKNTTYKFYVPIIRIPETLATIIGRMGGVIDPASGKVTPLPEYVTGELSANTTQSLPQNTRPEEIRQPTVNRTMGTPPAGRDAYGYFPELWPPPHFFLEPMTDKQRDMAPEKFGARMKKEWGAEEIDRAAALVLGALGLEADGTRGTTAVFIDFLMNASNESFDTCLGYVYASMKAQLDHAGEE